MRTQKVLADCAERGEREPAKGRGATSAFQAARALVWLIAILAAQATGQAAPAAHSAARTHLPGPAPKHARPHSRGGEREAIAQGRRLFTQETFHGNGRTCLTCHGEATGTLAPQEAQARAVNAALARRGLETDALFRAIDSDDGRGERYDRLLEHATVRVVLGTASTWFSPNKTQRTSSPS